MHDTSTLGEQARDELRAGFEGSIYEPGEGGYDDACTIFNGMFAQRPALVARPAGSPDVIRAIGMARSTGAPLAIRGGGHSVAGFSLCDGGIVVDLRGLNGVAIDPQARTARVQGGATWGEFDAAAQEHGLATTGGRVTTTGVAGFTLGSGSGWVERRLGFAADNLLSAELVTADGEVVRASEDENAELLWGLRGGGGNFGVVTEMEFRLAEIGPMAFGGLALFDSAKSHEVIRTWRDISADAPETIGWAVASLTVPPDPMFPEEWQLKRVIAVAGIGTGPQEETERIVQPLRALGPFVDAFQPLPYTAFQAILDPANPYGRRNYWRAHNLADLDEATIDTYVERAAAIPSPFTNYILVHMGGAVERVGEQDTALSGRNAPFNMHLNCMWEGAENDDANITWVRGTTEAFRPHLLPGMALNFTTEIGDAELRDCYGAKLDRLRALKQAWDPGNLFRLNQNIKP